MRKEGGVRRKRGKRGEEENTKQRGRWPVLKKGWMGEGGRGKENEMDRKREKKGWRREEKGKE